MKKYSVVLLFLISCGLAAVDEQKAKSLAESLMNDLKNEDYSRLDDYYTASFNESEPIGQKIDKYKKLKAAMGSIQSFELVSERKNDNMDEGGPLIELKYKMHCSNIAVTHTLVIINDEGKHRITFQNFEN